MANQDMNIALTDAIHANDLDRVILEVENGADANGYETVIREDGRVDTYTHLYNSIYNIPIAEYLITNGADVNIVSGPWRWTPLHKAASHGTIDIIKILLDQCQDNISVDYEDIHGNTAAGLAIKKQRYEVVAYINNHINVPVKGVHDG